MPDFKMVDKLNEGYSAAAVAWLNSGGDKLFASMMGPALNAVREYLANQDGFTFFSSRVIKEKEVV